VNSISTKQCQNMHALWDQISGKDFALRTIRRRYAEIVREYIDTLEIHRYIQLHPRRTRYQTHQTRIPDPRAKTTYKQPVLASDCNSLHQPLDASIHSSRIRHRAHQSRIPSTPTSLHRYCLDSLSFASFIFSINGWICSSAHCRSISSYCLRILCLSHSFVLLPLLLLGVNLMAAINKETKSSARQKITATQDFSRRAMEARHFSDVSYISDRRASVPKDGDIACRGAIWRQFLALKS
jgi:hypothetical protein